MTLLEVLQEKFGPSLQVAPWGDCLVIQGPEFNPDWEFELGDQGFRCHFGIQDDHPVTYVQFKKIVARGQTVYVNAKREVKSVDPLVEKPVRVDGDDVILDLVSRVQVLSEGYDSLNRAYVELKTDFERQMALIHPMLVEINVVVGDLKADFPKHKHAVSGEAMLPLEVS
jgi:hypothetical protein